MPLCAKNNDYKCFKKYEFIKIITMVKYARRQARILFYTYIKCMFCMNKARQT